MQTRSRVHAVVQPKHWIWIVLGAALSIGAYVAIRALVAEPAQMNAAANAPAAAPGLATTTPRAAAPVAAPPVTPPQAAAAESPPSAEDDVMRALDGKEPRRKAPAVPVQKPSGNYELHTVDGFSIVHLGAGPPTTKPFGGPSDDPTRTITGRVVDRSGKPVANAIVLADRGLQIRNDDMMTVGGAVTDAAGSFRVAAPEDEAFVIALVADDWSEIVAARDAPLELHMIGHGALAGRFTYDGGPETFEVRVKMQGAAFAGAWKTASDGTLAIRSLPPGRYTVDVGLAQAFLGGVSHSMTRDVTIVDGKTSKLALAFTRGTTLVLSAKPPAGSKPSGITYWLFSGRAPKDGAEARARKKPESAPSMMVGGGAKYDPVELHDVAPGAYYACAGFFDIATMDALDRPFGCTKVTVDDADTVREVSIVLAD